MTKTTNKQIQINLCDTFEFPELSRSVQSVYWPQNLPKLNM